tara:strand:+ start:43 stop:642 length:600 start_codon:yes stop_codon:yes gene_type:complete
MAITVTEVPQNQADAEKVLREQYGLEQKNSLPFAPTFSPVGLASLYGKIPTNMRLLVENLMGKKTPITEDDFTNEELLQMVTDLEKQGDGQPGTRVAINSYGDVPRGVVDASYLDSIRKSFTDPQYNVATSLGKYAAETLQDGYNIEDTYNFNRKERDLPMDLPSMLKRIRFSPELAGEYLANALGTPSRDVDIKLRKK